MCVSPVKIRNPNYHVSTPLIVATTDTQSQFINVPCGVCEECIAKKQSDLVQRCRVLSLDHYIFFYTLTYNNESLPRITCSNGVSIPYADHADITNMFKRIRKYNKFGYPFIYLSVSERGKTKGRPHFHGLIFVKKSYSNGDPLFTARLEKRIRSTLFSEWKRNYGSTRAPVWRPLFTYRSRIVGGVRYSNFDCHYVVPHSTEQGESDVAFYVTKYILKPNGSEKRLQQALRLNLTILDENGEIIDDSEYQTVWSIVRSKCTKSLDFGSATKLEFDFVRSQIIRSRSSKTGFQFYNPDGSVAPLARYYRKFVTAEDAVCSVASRGGPFAIRDRSIEDCKKSVSRGETRRLKMSSHDISELTTNLE